MGRRLRGVRGVIGCDEDRERTDYADCGHGAAEYEEHGGLE